MLQSMTGLTGSLLSQNEKLTLGIPNAQGVSLIDGGKPASEGNVGPRDAIAPTPLVDGSKPNSGDNVGSKGSFAPGFNPPEDLD